MITGITVPLYKPAGWTSFDVVNKCRRITGFRKVGHSGTLDPFAEGLLILGFGTHTRRLAPYKDLDKVYRVDIRLGAETDTQDRTGSIIAQSGQGTPPDLRAIEDLLPQFTGIIKQTPPMYSAKKVNGERLYTLARKGTIIEREAVPVRIETITILEYDWPLLRCRIRCGSGTYIRTLAADIGRALGCGAYALELLREQIGLWGLKECLTLDEFTEAWKSIRESMP
ncbi:MAG: tRNA pseudouridine(55) synthase TruB [bacterium]|nr:tRNA pseudouridine(55) synthase TruB [bacterium]